MDNTPGMPRLVRWPDLRAVTALLELAVLRQDLSDESRQHIHWLLNG